jgi:crotonobetainyl-CoA:carnitine CoA-transferase CaiB-like acyl-CoA transferase
MFDGAKRIPASQASAAPVSALCLTNSRRVILFISPSQQMFPWLVKLSETPGNPLGHAPELGEHTEAILTGMLGCSLGRRGAA